MSDTSTTIVPELLNYPDRYKKAQSIVEWLVAIQAINPVKTNCVLSTDSGYPIAKGAKSLTHNPEYLPFNLLTNGLDVITERTVFDAGENGLDSFICPNCKQDIVAEDWNFDDYFQTGNGSLICPLCNQPSDINRFIIEPGWGFSNLGFTFWNWSNLKEDFIEEFENKLQCKVKVIESRI